MNHDRTIKHLRIAEAFKAAELYVVHSDNKGPQFGFRLWDSLSTLSKEEADAFLVEFNSATEQLRQRWKRRFEDKAQAEFAAVRGKGL